MYIILIIYSRKTECIRQYTTYNDSIIDVLIVAYYSSQLQLPWPRPNL